MHVTLTDTDTDTDTDIGGKYSITISRPWELSSNYLVKIIFKKQLKVTMQHTW